VSGARPFASAALAVALFWSGSSLAGLAPVTRVGKRAHLAKDSRLEAELDTIRFRVLPDRVEATERLLIRNPGPAGTFVLGLPLPADRLRGPQAVRIKRVDGDRERDLRHWRTPSFGWRPVAFWRVCPLRLGTGERAMVVASWWQPHEAGELHGYFRYALSDPLWSAAAFAGPVGQLERRVVLEGGATFSSATPEAEEVAGGLSQVPWELHERRWRFSGREPGDRETLSLFYKLTRAAHSRCSGSDPWLAVDGDFETRWQPVDCPQGRVALELAAVCTGFGSSEPACDKAGGPTFDLGASVRTLDGKARAPVVVEGWWGRERVWTVAGQQNRRLAIARRDRVTRYRVIYPSGLGAGGAGEISLARLDPDASDPMAVAVLTLGRFQRATRRCRVVFAWRNPLALRHVGLRLKPGQKMDAFMLSTDCADGRRRVPYNEPVACNHSAAELAEIRRVLDEPDLKPMPHEHYRRKHPWQVELDLDETCAVTELRLVAPPVCTDEWRPYAPRLVLDY